MKSPLLCPINLQFFAADDGVSGGTGADEAGGMVSTDTQQSQSLDMAGLTALLNSMNQQSSGDNTNTNTAQQVPDQSQAQTDDTQNQAGEQNQQSNQSNQNTQGQKDANAFAAMRVRRFRDW